MIINLKCPYCRSQLLNDDDVISRHIREKHKITEFDEKVLEDIKTAKEKSTDYKVVEKLSPEERGTEPTPTTKSLSSKRYSAQPTGKKHWKSWG